MSRTFNRRQGLIAGCVVAAVHLLFLLYLHFAYHSVYEGLLQYYLSCKMTCWIKLWQSKLMFSIIGRARNLHVSVPKKR